MAKSDFRSFVKRADYRVSCWLDQNLDAGIDFNNIDCSKKDDSQHQCSLKDFSEMNWTQTYQLRKIWIIIVLILGGAPVTTGGIARAQIIPDAALGAESSVVTTVAPQVEQIDGGAARGSNLFHSFEEFSINEGWSANFANPTGIDNILSRVTGNNRSDIYGALGVLGDANLFLLNPNGIIFGPNAELNINGSFYASTADSFLFSDGR